MPETEKKPTYVPITEIPKKVGKQVSKYYNIFSAIPEDEALRIYGKKEIARFSRTREFFRDQGLRLIR